MFHFIPAYNDTDIHISPIQNELSNSDHLVFSGEKRKIFRIKEEFQILTSVEAEQKRPRVEQN